MAELNTTNTKLHGSGRLRFSQLSPPRQVLIRLCQSVNFGQICGLEVRHSDPTFSPAPTVFVELKLDSDEGVRPEIDLADFTLRDEVCSLMERLDELSNGTIERIDVRGGIPRRIVFEARLPEVPR